MLKITIKVEEKEEGKLNIGLKQISEKEFEKATQNEKIIASEIKMSIEDALKNIVEKEGK